MWVRGAATLLALCGVLTLTTADHGGNMAAWFSEHLDNMSYYKNILPPNDTDGPVSVFVQFSLSSLNSVEEINLRYNVDIVLRQWWQDTRLQFSPDVGVLTLQHEFYDRLWVPDVYFRNEKIGSLHDITVPNRRFRVEPDGSVYYSQRLSLVLGCLMDLHNYPMDNQTCSIEMETYGYTSGELMLYWHGASPVIIPSKLTLPDFNITGTEVTQCDPDPDTSEVFSCLQADFMLQRQYGYYVLQVYLSSLLVVVLSWVGFWVRHTAVPARTSLGIITVLTITTQASGIQSTLPKVSYVKAIDVWMTMCLSFVFGAVLEFSVVNYLADVKIPQQEHEHEFQHSPDQILQDKKQMLSEDVHQSPLASMLGEADVKRKKRSSCCPKGWLGRFDPPSFVDYLCRLLFPLLFGIFNFVYWTYYTP